jgi:hypothetical protein
LFGFEHQVNLPAVGAADAKDGVGPAIGHGGDFELGGGRPSGRKAVEDAPDAQVEYLAR